MTAGAAGSLLGGARRGPGRYILPCFLGTPIREYHRELVDAVADRFGLTHTQQQRIPAHFTLKYHFETVDIGPVEELLERFAGRQRRSPVTVGGFGHFDEDVVFVDVQLSDAARRTLADLLAALRGLPWMAWTPHDGEGLRPHVTIAERCRPRFAEVWAFLRPRERRFAAELDNVTLLEQAGEADGVDRWAVRRSFALAA